MQFGNLFVYLLIYLLIYFTEKDTAVRAQREAAQKAIETVRKNIVTLNNDSDTESNDPTNMIPYNRKPRGVSPSPMKRYMDGEDRVDSSAVKKMKTDTEKENAPGRLEPAKPEARKTLDSVRQFFLRDSKQKLKKLTQEVRSMCKYAYVITQIA